MPTALLGFITETDPHLCPHRSAPTVIYTSDMKTRTHFSPAVTDSWNYGSLDTAHTADDFDKGVQGTHQIASCFEETPTGDRTVAGLGQCTHSCFHVCLR